MSTVPVNGTSYVRLVLLRLVDLAADTFRGCMTLPLSFTSTYISNLPLSGPPFSHFSSLPLVHVHDHASLACVRTELLGTCSASPKYLHAFTGLQTQASLLAKAFGEDLRLPGVARMSNFLTSSPQWLLPGNGCSRWRSMIWRRYEWSVQPTALFCCE